MSAATRPLRWIKLGAGIAAGALALRIAAPSWEAAAFAGRFAELAAPWRLLPGLALGAFAAASWVWLLLDAALDLRAPRGLLALLVGAGVAAASAPSIFAAPAAGPSAATLLPPALAKARAAAAQALARGASLEELRERIAASLPAPVHVDRWLRPLPFTAVVLEGRDGPVISPRPGDPPGTVYLAIAPGGGAGWLTASVLEGGRTSILRDAGRPLVRGVVPCAGDRAGGAGC
ncbi:MAG TPA: hypothetical protein VN033_11725 [Vulgatibacter sp.]|nr:hypothetical protein [Vulgatibacter sp.]